MHRMQTCSRLQRGSLSARLPASLTTGVDGKLRASASADVTISSSARVEKLRHILADGCGLELLVQRANPASQAAGVAKPPLLFVHGSYHSAWCWAEKFLPYFADRGYDTYAVSMRSQGASDAMEDDLAFVAGTLDSHAADLADLAEWFQQSAAPLVVSHSFGGLILQKYILKMQSSAGEPGFPRLAGTAFLNSVPPSGNRKLVMRFLRKDLLLSCRVTWGFITKSFVRSTSACRELFFSSDLPEADLIRYQKQLAKTSNVRLIDLTDTNKQVPLPPPPAHAPPSFVFGGASDCVVDVPAIEELAEWAGVQPVILQGVAHDCMLDTRWEQVASKLDAWISTLPSTSTK